MARMDSLGNGKFKGIESGVIMKESRIGVCSWSLQPESPGDLVEKVRATGVSAIQLALDPIRRGEWSFEETVSLLGEAGIRVHSGMMGTKGEDYSTLKTIRETGGVRIDGHWKENLDAAKGNAEIAMRMGIGLVTFHAGFFPHNGNDPVRRVMLERLGMICDMFDEVGIRVGFETGQETAQTLLGVLKALDRATSTGVNFDPANMILYGMGDPVEALRALSGAVVQIHIKDALPAEETGAWGTEVAVGDGAVVWPGFLEVLQECSDDCNLVIEREAGGERIEEIRRARELMERLLAGQ